MNPFILSFKAKGLNAAIHRHSAFQIVYSHNNAFHSTLDNENNENIFGFIIKPHVSHACRENNSLLSIINIEPFSTTGAYIDRLFPTGKNYIPFTTPTDIFTYLPIDSTDNIEHALNKVVAENDHASNLDNRIATIINYIQVHYDQKLSVKTLSNLVYLSPSRLSSLFKQQTGSSLSKYVLWTRIRRAIHLSLSSKQVQLSTIASQTGFYDLPQLNKYMYEMIGVPPKGFKNNSDLIQVL